MYGTTSRPAVHRSTVLMIRIGLISMKTDDHVSKRNNQWYWCGVSMVLCGKCFSIKPLSVDTGQLPMVFA